MSNTPNAEKYVLEADSMRRRQLRSALLHGRRRTWREHARAWPAVAIGVIVVGVILAALAVVGAYNKSKNPTTPQLPGVSQAPTPAASASPAPTRASSATGSGTGG